MMSYDMDTKRMLKALRIGKEKVSDKAIKSAEKEFPESRIIPISHVTR